MVRFVIFVGLFLVCDVCLLNLSSPLKKVTVVL